MEILYVVKDLNIGYFKSEMTMGIKEQNMMYWLRLADASGIQASPLPKPHDQRDVQNVCAHVI